MPHFLKDITPSDLKYLQDLSDELTNYLSTIIISIYDGVTRNIGQKPEPLPKDLKKALLPRFAKLGLKLKGIIGRSIKQKPDKPFVIRNLNLYKKGKPLTNRQWEEFNKQVLEFLRPHIDGIAEEMAVKGVLLSMASNEAERQKKNPEDYGKKSYKQVENTYFGGAIPDTIRGTNARFNLSKNVKKSLALSYNHVADYVTNVNDELRTSIKQQVIAAHRTGKSARELASDLYWQKVDKPEMKKYTAEINARDWRRLAFQELAMIHESGKLAQYEDQAERSVDNPDEALYFVFIGAGICKWCDPRLGTVVRLVPMELVKNEADDSLLSFGLKDSYTNIAIWNGKNNIGYKQAQWRICTPAHVNCSCTFARIDPVTQEWDKKTKRIKYKHGQKFEKYLPDWFVKERETMQAEIQRKEDLAAKKREENYYKTYEQVVAEQAKITKKRKKEQARLQKELNKKK
jgi:hypothetical protein